MTAALPARPRQDNPGGQRPAFQQIAQRGILGDHAWTYERTAHLFVCAHERLQCREQIGVILQGVPARNHPDEKLSRQNAPLRPHQPTANLLARSSPQS